MVSLIKRANIIEARAEWKKACRHKTQVKFVDHMEKRGWEHLDYDCAFKTCLAKNSIVIKFSKYSYEDTLLEIKREYEQWLYVPQSFKKHLPRIYLYENNAIIQDRVLKVCHNWNCKLMLKVAKEFPIEDYHQNHGHNIRGMVKFYDWVWKRDGSALDLDGEFRR